jgi:hypothetical protein
VVQCRTLADEQIKTLMRGALRQQRPPLQGSSEEDQVSAIGNNAIVCRSLATGTMYKCTSKKFLLDHSLNVVWKNAAK